MKRWGRTLTLVAALCVVSIVKGPAHAGVPSVTITPVPTKLELCLDGQAGQVFVVVQNGDTSPIHNICLRAFTKGPVTLDLSSEPALLSHDGVQAKTGKSDQESCDRGVALPELMPGATLSSLLTLKLIKYFPTSEAVFLLVDYQFGEKSKGAKGTAASVLDVHVPAAPGMDLLKVDAKTNFASLHENQSGSVLLTINNGTNDTLKLSSSTTNDPYTTSSANKASGPNYKVTPQSTTSQMVPPQSVITIPYTITASANITPGKYVGLIDVDAQTSCGVSIHRVASYDVTLSVFGESGLLTTIGVPSLLFLPGFLILTLWMLLWRLGLRVSFLAKAPGSDEFFVGAKDEVFWLLGITLSLILFFALPRVMGIGYLKPYNLANIAELWLVSLIISLVLYLALLWLDYWRKGRTLTLNDDVLETVAKMAKRRWPRANCRPVKSKAGVLPEIQGFKIWEEKPGKSIWVIPPIEWVVKEGDRSEFDPAKADIDFSELLRQLREIDAKKIGVVRWASMSGFSAPCVKLHEELDDLSSGELVVVRTQSQ